jgi:rhodanese-related sulfurtransferase
VLAVEAVEMLRKFGFKAVRLEGGIQDWRAMGFALVAPNGRGIL